MGNDSIQPFIDYSDKGVFIKWNPAVKTEEDQRALWQGLESNKLDIIATDHAPHTREEKGNSYFTCPSGAPMVQHALPMMLEQGSGYFMNTASAAGLLTQLGAAGYSVTKSAAVSFAEWLKITYGERGIGVSCLCPQGVRTPMVEDAPEIVGSLVSIDGLLEPDVVANEVIECIEKDQFLVTPHPEVLEYMKIKASDPDRWITGMQSLTKQLIESFPEAETMLKDLNEEEDSS